VAFNVIAFPHVLSNNLNAQVHYYALLKAFYQFNITRVMHRSGSVRRFDNCPSGLIFLLFLTQVGPFYIWLIVSPSPLLASFWILACRRPLLKFGSLSILARCRLHFKFGPFSALLNLHSPTTCRRRWLPRQPLSFPEITTIYDSFSAFATAVIIVSDF
jgi:hypothetical protein